MNHKEKYSMTEYFDIAIDNGALLLDASNLDWLTFPLYSCIRDEIHRQVDLRTIDFDWGYNSPGGKDELKELIAKHESHIEKTTIDKDEIVLTGNGTTGALNYVLQCILKLNHFNTGIKVMYGVPSYDGFDRALDFYEFKPVQILLQKDKDYRMTLDNVKKAYSKDCKVIIISNPSNPSVTFINKDEIEKILKFAIEKDMYIIYDAIFEESPSYTNSEYPVYPIVKDYPKFIKVKGLSKDAPHLSDFRCGWTICKNKKLNELLLKVASSVNFSNSTFLENIEIAEMRNRVEIDENISSEYRYVYEEDKKLYNHMIKDTLNAAYDYLMSQNDVVENVIYPDCGNILYITLNKQACNKKGVYTSHELFMYIMEKENISITPGHCFGAPLEDLAFRVTISRGYDAFMNGIERIVKLFK